MKQKEKKASSSVVMILVFGVNLWIQIKSYYRLAGLNHIFSPEKMADILTESAYCIALYGVALLYACWGMFISYMPWQKKNVYLAEGVFSLFTGMLSCVLWKIGSWAYWSIEMKLLLAAVQTVMLGWGVYSIWKYRKEQN